MATLIQSTRNEPCAICHTPFNEGERQWTHEGGAQHAGFHGKCFSRWLELNPTCPFDRAPIDPRSIRQLDEETGRIWERKKLALKNAALAAVYAVVGWQAALSGASLILKIMGKNEVLAAIFAFPVGISASHYVRMITQGNSPLRVGLYCGWVYGFITLPVENWPFTLSLFSAMITAILTLEPHLLHRLGL